MADQSNAKEDSCVKNINYKDSKIAYHLTGSGQPVIFLHGFGEDSGIWTSITEFLGGQYHVVIPDLPGSGHSEMIADMSMAGMAEVIHSIIHEEHFDQCTVIGHSMGGYIALALAENYPNHISALGLFHSTAYPDTEEKKMARQKGIELIGEKGPVEFIKNSTLNLFAEKTKKEKPEIVKRQLAAPGHFSADALIAYYRSMIARPDRRAILRELNIPALFIMGVNDPAIPFQDCLEQSHLPAVSFITILRDSGHLGMLEEPERAKEAVNAFLSWC